MKDISEPNVVHLSTFLFPLKNEFTKIHNRLQNLDFFKTYPGKFSSILILHFTKNAV